MHFYICAGLENSNVEKTHLSVFWPQKMAVSNTLLFSFPTSL